jgi:hypothetical protein
MSHNYALPHSLDLGEEIRLPGEDPEKIVRHHLPGGHPFAGNRFRDGPIDRPTARAIRTPCFAAVDRGATLFPDRTWRRLRPAGVFKVYDVRQPDGSVALVSKLPA